LEILRERCCEVIVDNDAPTLDVQEVGYAPGPVSRDESGDGLAGLGDDDFLASSYLREKPR
jgi:hypothetical protein